MLWDNGCGESGKREEDGTGRVLWVSSLLQRESPCLHKYDLRANCFPQFVHLNGFESEWVWICAFRLLLSANFLLQSVHLNGLSPVCVRMWPENTVNITTYIHTGCPKKLPVCVCAPGALYGPSNSNGRFGGKRIYNEYIVYCNMQK